jgi:hypothetical protein
MAQPGSYAMDGDNDKSLFEKAIESVKDIASSVTEAVKSTPPSARTETAIPPVEENFDAPPMTAEELAHHAAADTQPVTPAKKAPRKKTTSPNLSGRITPTYDFPPPDSPMPSSKKRKGVVKKAKKPAKAAKKKAVKQAAKKTKSKKGAPPKKSAKKSKKARKKSKP